MMIFENRASTILFNYLKSNHSGNGYWLIPLNACPLVPIVFKTAGIRFKLVDINNINYCMDEELIKEAVLDRNCSGMIYIYSYGIQSDEGRLFKNLKECRPDFKIVEDKCLCMPSLDFNSKSKFADLTIYSTGYGKVVELGIGGFGMIDHNSKYNRQSTGYDPSMTKQLEQRYKICLNNQAPLEPLNPSWIDDRLTIHNDLDGYKKRFNKIRKKVISRKREINSIYKSIIPVELWMKHEGQPVDTWRFNLLLPYVQDELIQQIFSRDLFVSQHYQPVDKIFETELIGTGEVAYTIYDKVLNLFNDLHFTVTMATQLGGIIFDFQTKNRKVHEYSI